VNRTLAITGATGFLGQAVMARVTANSRPVRALTRRAQSAIAQVHWTHGTLADPAALDELVSGAHAVLHIAGAVNVPSRADFAAANIAGTQAIVDAATRAGVRQFIHVSSLAAREPDMSNYGWSKSEAERVVQRSKLDWTIVRPPAIYGPRDAEMLELFKMAKRGFVLLPPPGRASLIHVDDLARLLQTLSAQPQTGQIYEVDDTEPLSHRELALRIGTAVGRAKVASFSAPAMLLHIAARADRLVRRKAAKLTPDRANYMVHPDWTCDPALAPPPGLWRPKIASRDGLAATARWYREQGWL
jgi:nucleoside-diphosphate-sugar epimerase